MNDIEPPKLIWTGESYKGTTLRLYSPNAEDPMYALSIGEDWDLHAIYYIEPQHILSLLRGLRDVKNDGAW